MTIFQGLNIVTVQKTALITLQMEKALRNDRIFH